MTDKTRKSVPLAPSLFMDNPARAAAENIADMPLEDVIVQYQEIEQKRGRNKDQEPSEEEVSIVFKVVPEGLLHSLQYASTKAAITRSMLTRCLTHQIGNWLDTQDGILLLKEMYQEVYFKTADLGYPDLGDQLSGSEFRFVRPRLCHTSLQTTAWMRDKLTASASFLGMRPYALFHIGLIRSLSRNRSGWFKNTTTNFLNPEMDNFRGYLEERQVSIRAVMERLKLREDREPDITYTFSKKGQK